MLEIKNIYKEYKTGTLIQRALDGVSLSFRENEFVAILGPSGSGKTTLLNIIGGLDHADRGELTIDDIPTSSYKSRDWDAYRNHSVGFIFQSYHLIPHQTLLRNVELAMTLAGVSSQERRERAAEELGKVVLEEQMHKKPAQLSGGQMQRVAIARALVNHPTIVLADEPTGALDSDTGEQVMELLREVAQDHLVIMVTHNPDLAQRFATRIIELKDGKILSDSNPYIPGEEPLEPKGQGQKESYRQKRRYGISPRRQARKPSMSFLTALSLSVSNLLSKKARTILVAFAASIGITGIALILSLSNGAHSYIGRMEEQALSEYPLQISSSSFSMDTMMEAFAEMRTATIESMGEDPGEIREQQILGGMFSGTGTNDLASLKNWFDSGESGIEEATRSISYSYGVSPQIYLKEENGYRQVNPDQTMSAMGLSMDDSLSSMMSIWSGNDVFYSLPENEELYRDSYEILAGHWPRKDTELVLVLMPRGGVPDFLLYTMGLKDSSELEQRISNFMSGEAVDTSMGASSFYEPEDFLGISFRILPAYKRFSYDEQLGVWLDCANDQEAMEALLDKAEELEIVGVVAPTADSRTSILYFGLDYPAHLMTRLMEDASTSPVVRAQLATPGMDVLTGSTFGEYEDTSMADMSSLFEIHPEYIPDAISIKWDQLGSALGDQDLMSTVDTVRTIRELSRTGTSPTLKKVLGEFLTSLMDLIEIDEEQLGKVISMEMDEARMQEMYAARAAAAQSSYKGNLVRFGYADPESPGMITIYPKDFESKETVITILESYNRAMEKSGYDEKVITYTDYVGSLMSSVTTIIDVITYVLIAFVAVSLIVSSIMIGIITYISVLERRKEIGILRAMGASRHNITQVFNAETFIIGVLAGAFGILLTLLFQIPINAIIHSFTDQPVRAFLPSGAAGVLIALCIILNIIGGLIPAKKASLQDPVAALRSE